MKIFAFCFGNTGCKESLHLSNKKSHLFDEMSQTQCSRLSTTTVSEQQDLLMRELLDAGIFHL